MTEYPIARARAQNRDISDELLPDAVLFPAGHGLAKGAYRAGAGGAAECHFPDNARKAYHNDKEEIGSRKVPPPYLETLAGNIHILPIPTAEPMQDRINPQFVFQESL